MKQSIEESVFYEHKIFNTLIDNGRCAKSLSDSVWIGETGARFCEQCAVGNGCALVSGVAWSGLKTFLLPVGNFGARPIKVRFFGLIAYTVDFRKRIF